MKDSIHFSSYLNLKGKEFKGQVSLKQLQDRIISNPDHRNDISGIRVLRKTNKCFYNDLKSKLLIITPHGQFESGQKCDKNLIELNGLVFIDIEESNPEIDEILFNQPEIIAVWKSTSGEGSHALASLDGLNPDNFKKYHLAYLNSLKVKFGIIADDKVCYISSGLVVSSDPDARFKEIWTPLDIKELDSYVQDSKNVPYQLEGILPTWDVFEDMITSSRLPEYPSDVVYIKEGLPFIKCYLPYTKSGRIAKIQVGERNKTLSSYVNNLIILNKGKDLNEFYNHMLLINNNFCTIPMSNEEIYLMVKNKFDKSYRLLPLKAKLKYYWIRPDYDGDKRELYYGFRRDQTQDKINEWFECELGEIKTKVTMELICKNIEIGRTTLNRYLTSVHKEIIKIHNKEIKSKTSHIGNIPSS